MTIRWGVYYSKWISFKHSDIENNTCVCAFDMIMITTWTGRISSSAWKCDHSLPTLNNVRVCIMAISTTGVSVWSFYAHLQNREKRLLASSCLSVCPYVRLSICPHGTIQLPLNGSSWNLMFEYFSKICWLVLSFIHMGQE